MFEHPWGSDVWDDSEMVPLRRKFGIRRVDMCAYGLSCPDTGLPIRKATGLMLSCRPEDRNHVLQRCPGCAEHRLVAGKLRNGQNVSEYVASYTSQFVNSIMDMCLPEHPSLPTHQVDLAACEETECLADGAVLAPAEAQELEPVPAGENSSQSLDDDAAKVQHALKRLHVNLGHPSNRDLVRILQHSKASAKAIQMARDFECTVCANHQKPTCSMPAKVSRVWDFNERIGLDVKYLPGWKVNQRVPCVSIVDYASSLHVMAPIFERESAELIKGVLRDAWINWAGPPKVLELDPSRPNLSDELAQFCQTLGIDIVHTAADAHWQLGKVERQGQWFEQILTKVHEECPPNSAEQFVDNVMQVQVAKNSLITVSGASPFQIVFGRNPRVPQDLMQDDVHVPAVDATLFENASQRAATIRQAARCAVLQCQDEKALKAALRSRPRPRREFASGDWVYYWRTQKWQEGQLVKGGRWYGAGMILGRLGINFIVAHRRSIFRCSPEQLRFATSEEQEVAKFDESELLGIKNLLEKGQFPKSQFTDLVNQEGPPSLEEAMNPDSVQPDGAKSAAQLFEERAQNPRQDFDLPDAKPDTAEDPTEPVGEAVDRQSAYGPIRRRHRVKSPEAPLFRPAAMAHDDLAEILQETIPQMIEDHLMSTVGNGQVGGESSSPRGASSKREASADPATPRESTRAKVDGVAESLFSEHDGTVPNFTIEALTAAFIQKKLQKEIPAVGNEPDMQSKVEASKALEWETLLGKNAVRIWRGDKAKAIRRHQSDRFIGSRVVIINKQDEDGERVKSRWCLQGHLDPDFQEKIRSGACHSPTLHPLSRALLLQIISSKKWTLQLGDIKGAFLEAGPIDKKFSPLYAHQPQGGVPGLEPEDVIEVLGNVYGANDAPLNWFNTFDTTTKQIGWEQSQFDRCLYYLRDKQGQLVGVLGAHVDDTITAGSGSIYEAAVAALRQRFPYRKWRIGNGEYCGVQYNQDPQTFNITYGQKEYSEHLRPINLTKDRLKNKDALASEKEVAALRAINGAANWISSQSRPDLAVQTSFSQQCFPDPKVYDLVFANQLVHRAKQNSDVEITIQSIPWNDIGIAFHSDAAFGNAKGHRTQAGYIAAFVDKNLSENQPSKWSPFAWKSFKLPRVVASTLAGEAQCFTTASAVAEWMSLLLAEANHGSFDLRTKEQVQSHAVGQVQLKCRDDISMVSIVGITDCKSLYDHVSSLSSVSKCEDKRVAIDLAILRQCMKNSGLQIRWCPSELMLADALTKDQFDPNELLRTALQIGEYQLNKEATILAVRKDQRAAREAQKRRRNDNSPPKAAKK